MGSAGVATPSGASTHEAFSLEAVDFGVEAADFAVRSHAKKLGTEHILAAAIFALPEDSKSYFGKGLYEHISALLKKSSLEPRAPGLAANVGNGLPHDPLADQLLTVFEESGSEALLTAVSE